MSSNFRASNGIVALLHYLPLNTETMKGVVGWSDGAG